MPASDHPIFWGLRDYEWSAVSSIATGLATVIALVVPLTLRVADRRKEQRAEQARRKAESDAKAAEAVHVADAFSEASRIAMEARAEFNNLRRSHQSGHGTSMRLLSPIATKAARRAEVLRALADQPHMKQLAISCLLAAARAMDTISAIVTANEARTGNDLIRGLTEHIEQAMDQLMIVDMDLWDMLTFAGATYDRRNVPWASNAWDSDLA